MNDEGDGRRSIELPSAKRRKSTGISPRPIITRGVLAPLKTTLELRSSDAYLDVYITAVPVKNANTILKSVFHCPSIDTEN
jgi:hypothetical protein